MPTRSATDDPCSARCTAVGQIDCWADAVDAATGLTDPVKRLPGLVRALSDAKTEDLALLIAPSSGREGRQGDVFVYFRCVCWELPPIR